MSCSISIDAVGHCRMIWVCRFYVHIVHDDFGARYCLAAAEVNRSIVTDGCAMESIISHITHFDCRFLQINNKLVDSKACSLSSLLIFVLWKFSYFVGTFLVRTVILVNDYRVLSLYEGYLRELDILGKSRSSLHKNKKPQVAPRPSIWPRPFPTKLSPSTL